MPVTTQRRTINIVCSHYPPHVGGIERFAELQAKELVRLGFHVNVITNDTEELGFLETRDHISIYRLKFLGFINNRLPFPYDVRQLMTVYRDCFKANPALTVVHGRYYALTLIGCVMARLSPSMLALIDHSSDYIQMTGRFFNVMARVYEHCLTYFIMIFKPKVFGVAEACNKWLRRFGIQAAGVYYNGLDLECTEAPLSDIRQTLGAEGRTIVLAVGRLVREKGIGELVSCFETSERLRKKFLLIVIGTGELAEEIEEISRTNPSVIFLGRQRPEVVLAYMKQAGIFVNPSNYPEGLPTILLEAGRYGLTVITTPNGGASEVVQHQKTGIVIPEGRAATIERALLDLCTPPSASHHLGEELRKTIFARFSFKEITRKFIIDDLGVKPS